MNKTVAKNNTTSNKTTNNKARRYMKKPIVLGMAALIILLGLVFLFYKFSPLNMVTNPATNSQSQDRSAIDQNRVAIISRHITDEEFQKNIEDVQKKELAVADEKVINEATVAIDETQKALQSLEDNKKDDALSHMEKALGKLDVLLTKDPNAALIPLYATSNITSLVADKDTIAKNRASAEQLMTQGDLQGAREMLDTLVSEIRISSLNIPLQTYPDAIRSAVKLVNENKNEEAKTALRAALNTLVIKDRVIPIPLLNAQLLVNKAANTVDKDTKQTLEMIEDAKTRIEVAELLGYGKATPEMFTQLYADVTRLEERINNNEKTTEQFDPLKKTLQDLKQQISQ